MGSRDSEADGFLAVGPHGVRVEPPDVLHLRFCGDITDEHAQRVLEVLDAIPPGPRLYLLRDARRGGAPSSSARARIARDPRIDRFIAVVSYGSAYQHRVIVTLLEHAMRVLRPKTPRFLFFDTEPEARAFIEADRARRA
jgi:hypothetical protein